VLYLNVKIQLRIRPKSCFCFDQESNNRNEDSNLEPECETLFFRNYLKKISFLSMSREPQLLLGLPKERYLKQQKDSAKYDNFKKILLYQPNTILALDFGLST
jgi:hypothetical protein